MDTRPPPSAVVLAAGEGRRMGGAKALLVVDGVALVHRHLLRLHEAGCRTMAVVVRPGEAPLVSELVRAAPYAAWVRVVAAATGSQADSLAAGIRALLAEGAPGMAPGAAGGRAVLAEEAPVKVPRGALLVTPVDMLPPKLETVRALLAALEGDVLAATPLRRGRGGHPVAARFELLAPYLVGEAGRELPSLRDVLAGAAHRRVRVEVDDDSIHGDLDTPSDVRAAAGGAWPVFIARDAS